MQLEEGGQSIDDIEDRISSYKKLSKKHNVSEDNLIEIEESIKSKIISLDNKENKLLEIRNDLDETKKKFSNHSELISSQRLKNQRT